MSSTILPEETIHRLQANDPALIGQPKNGQRKISTGLFTPPSSSTSRSVSSSSGAAATTMTTYIMIPTHLDSPATFEFLGFTEERADKMHTDRNSHLQEKKEDVDHLEWATRWIEGVCSIVECADSEDDWISTLTEVGIKKDIQDVFAKPEYEKIKLIQPLCSWLVEIAETYYYALTELSATLQTLTAEDVHLRGGQGDVPEDVPQMPGGHLALYKSVEFRRSKGVVSEDGEAHLFQLESNGATDFCRRGGLYFTHQMWVAEKYASLINEACPVADRRTVELHVPLSHFQSVGIWQLKFEDDDFKRLLYHSRRSEKYPKDIKKKRGGHGVIAGPVCHSHNRAFGKMTAWENIKEGHQLHNEDDPSKVAHQHCWVRESAIEKLEEDVKGKVYLRKTSPDMQYIPEPWNDTSVKVGDDL